MAVDSSDGFDYLVAFNLHTCGAVGDELGSDESDVILIAWAIVDAKQNTVRGGQSHISECSQNTCSRGCNSFSLLRHSCLTVSCSVTCFLSMGNVMPAVLCGHTVKCVWSCWCVSCGL